MKTLLLADVIYQIVSNTIFSEKKAMLFQKIYIRVHWLVFARFCLYENFFLNQIVSYVKQF